MDRTKQSGRLHAGVQAVDGIDVDGVDACSRNVGDQCDDYRACSEHGIQFSLDGNERKRFGLLDNECDNESHTSGSSGELQERLADGQFRDAFVGGTKQFDRLRA